MKAVRLLLVPLVLAGLMLCWSQRARADESKRVALVIGNGGYSDVPQLPNPPGDAAAIGQALKEVGFTKVTVVKDLTHQGLFAALRQFAAESASADWSVLYYAGHGIEVDGKNYLVPVDAHLATDRDVEFEGVAMQTVLAAVSGARQLRLVILDACRDDPFLNKMKKTNGTRSLSRGLARVEPQGELYIVYSAKSGQVAMDGDKGRSPFVDALLSNIKTPGLEVNLLFRKVHADVKTATHGQQEPAFEGELPGEELYFRPATGSASQKHETVPPRPDPVEIARAERQEEPTWSLPQADPVETARLEPDRAPQPSARSGLPSSQMFSFVAGLNPQGDNFLALRESPGGRLILRMQPGTLLTVTARSGPWAQVALQTGEVGWASASFIVCCRGGAGGPRPGTPPVRATPAPTQSSWSFITGLDPGGDNFLALKATPDIRAARLMKLGPQTLFRVIGRSGDWMQVQLRTGQSGWVSSRYVSCCQAAE